MQRCDRLKILKNTRTEQFACLWQITKFTKFTDNSPHNAFTYSQYLTQVDFKIPNKQLRMQKWWEITDVVLKRTALILRNKHIKLIRACFQIFRTPKMWQLLKKTMNFDEEYHQKELTILHPHLPHRCQIRSLETSTGGKWKERTTDIIVMFNDHIQLEEIRADTGDAVNSKNVAGHITVFNKFDGLLICRGMQWYFKEGGSFVFVKRWKRNRIQDTWGVLFNFLITDSFRALSHFIKVRTLFIE